VHRPQATPLLAAQVNTRAVRLHPLRVNVAGAGKKLPSTASTIQIASQRAQAYQGRRMPVNPSELRAAAADAITNLVRQRGDILHWSEIARGFLVRGERVLFANQARGIFKPAALNDGAALSIKSSRPSRVGRMAVYEDELVEDGLLRYKLQGTDPHGADNLLLRQAAQQQVPLIYFSGLADSTYQVFFPVFVTAIDLGRMEALTAWKSGDVFTTGSDSVVDDPYRMLGKRTAVNRLHYARFRASVLCAYGFRCAFSGAPIGSLLTVGRILPDAESKGVAAVNNAICMSVLHHAAFEANLIGVDRRLKVHAGSLIDQPEHRTLKKLILDSVTNEEITVPRARSLRPDVDCLESRFALFEAAQS
jgi:putative restriction endonuclease